MRTKTTPEKIDEVLALLAKAWKQYPEQRLGQVLLNISRNMYGTTGKQLMWNLTNDEIIEVLEDLIKNGW